jgi:heterodisulfide reductase subunit C
MKTRDTYTVHRQTLVLLVTVVLDLSFIHCIPFSLCGSSCPVKSRPYQPKHVIRAKPLARVAVGGTLDLRS